MRVSSVSSFKQLTRKRLNKNNFNDPQLRLYISQNSVVEQKSNLEAGKSSKQHFVADSFTGISNTRYRRMVKSDFQLDDFLVDAAFIFIE